MWAEAAASREENDQDRLTRTIPLLSCASTAAATTTQPHTQQPWREVFPAFCRTRFSRSTTRQARHTAAAKHRPGLRLHFTASGVCVCALTSPAALLACVYVCVLSSSFLLVLLSCSWSGAIARVRPSRAALSGATSLVRWYEQRNNSRQRRNLCKLKEASKR